VFSVLRPDPDLRARVWGGRRLAHESSSGPIGEAWIAGPTSRVGVEQPEGKSSRGRSVPGGAATFDELAALHGRSFVGSRSPWPDRIPLLVKLLDPAGWLSVQVHPDDDLARQLAGPGAVGKTEAWRVLEVELLVGVRPGAADAQVRAAIRRGGLAALLQRLTLSPGDTVLVPAGTLLAVGPGVFL
jgi:mannose-6-phosphate isomerase